MFKDLLLQRRSCRQFSEREIQPDDVELILRAALLSPSSRGRRTWHFVVVERKEDLEKLSEAKSSGSDFLKCARLAVVVCADAFENDCWIEDGAIAAYGMLLQAEELGIGGCWCQIHKRMLSDGTHSEDVVRGILDIPENVNVLCIAGFGYRNVEQPPSKEENLKWENVHLHRY